MPSFTQIGQNPKEEFEKVGFPVFAILRKYFLGRSGRGHLQSDSAPFSIQADVFPRTKIHTLRVLENQIIKYYRYSI